MDVRAAEPEDLESCVEIIAALPDYFTPSTHGEVRLNLLGNPAWVAVEGAEVLGFVLAPLRFAEAAEITFAAVRPSWRNRGIGTALVERCLAELATLGVSMVEVKTLDASANFEPYVATRAFWERRRFVQIDCIDPLPGWEPGNPSAIYARSVR